MVNFATMPLTYKKIWSDALNIYKITLSKIWFVAALLGICVSLSSIYANYFKIEPDQFSIIQGVFLGISFLAGIYFTNVILHRIKVIDIKPEATLKQSLVFVLHKYPQLFFALLIVTVVTVAGLALFIVPGVFAAIMLLFAGPLILFDDKGVFASLRDSCVLVWKYWFRTFAVIFPVILLNLAISTLLGLINLHLFWIAFVLNLVVSIFYFPFFYSVLLVQFHDLKVRRAVGKAINN